jgi:hypothetical protein
LHHDWSNRWRLKTTDDAAAILIENAASGFALDAGEYASKDNSRDPHLGAPHWAPWQQWIIVRVALK